MNAEADGLGRPLPQGIVRVYQVGERTQQFLGEDRIRHTARDETLRLTVGRAFDVVGERRQTDFRVLGQCSSESAWEIALRNRKQESVEVEVVEHAGGDWEIVDSSHKPQKRDASSFVFRVPVPASGSATVTYRARVRWC